MLLKQETIKLDLKNGTAQGVIRVIEFKDHEFYIAFNPTLNISGYGESEKEALDMLFHDVLFDFFQNLLKLTEAEISCELSKYGYDRSRIFNSKKSKRYTGRGPVVSSAKILENLNLPPETPIKEKYLEVA